MTFLATSPKSKDPCFGSCSILVREDGFACFEGDDGDDEYFLTGCFGGSDDDDDDIIRRLGDELRDSFRPAFF
jgi:hypothetical protein